MPTGPFVKVRTGKSSYLKMTQAEADVYRARHGEYGAPAAVDVASVGDDLDGLTVAELQAKADERGIEAKGLKKAELIAALRASESDAE